jgi:translation initiation factor 1A
MPKNVKGGKAYKRMKQGGDDETNFVECDFEAGQQYGRILRNLGGMNMIVYCNDDYERICHIRGGIKKSCRLKEGDIVIFSLRDLYNGEGGGKTQKGHERGDILARVDPRSYSQIRRDPAVNSKLFLSLETMDDKTRKVPASQQAGFIFGYDSDDEKRGDDDEEEEEGQNQTIPAGPAGGAGASAPAKPKKRTMKWAIQQEDDDDDNFDVGNIDEI